MSSPGSVVVGARRFVLLLGIAGTVKCSDVAPLLHRVSPVVVPQSDVMESHSELVLRFCFPTKTSIKSAFTLHPLVTITMPAARSALAQVGTDLTSSSHFFVEPIDKAANIPWIRPRSRMCEIPFTFHDKAGKRASEFPPCLAWKKLFRGDNGPKTFAHRVHRHEHVVEAVTAFEEIIADTCFM